jgi:hypothetical protein
MLDAKVLSYELVLGANIVEESDLREGPDIRI